MKKMFFTFAVLAFCITAAAQNTRVIKGSVIDKNGVPVSGATVKSTGGSDITTVDADGSFSLEVPIWLKSATAQCNGMIDKKLKITDGNYSNMVFRMIPKGDRQWFVIGNYAYCSEGDSNPGHMGGLMVGNLGKWGWYGRFFVGKSTYEDSESIIIWSVTGGVTKRIVKPLHVYAGIGTGALPHKYYTFQGVVPEIGLIVKIGKHFLIQAGYQAMIEPSDPNVAHVANVGIGYAF